jgi:hypothetical protein
MKLGTVPVWGGIAVLATNQISAGSNAITAVFTGYPTATQTDFAGPTTSNTVTQTVAQEDVSVSLTAATSNPNPSTYGVPLTFTATVTANNGAIVQTGSLTLYNGTAKLATYPVSNGQVVFTLPTPANNFLALPFNSNAYSITAVYTAKNNPNGETSFVTGQPEDTSNAVPQTVNTQASTSVTVTPAAATPAGQNVTITATVTNTASGSVVAPVGQVTFYDGDPNAGGVKIAVKSVINGVATLTTNRLSKGSHDIWAVYSDPAGPTGNFAGSSNDATQVIS